MCKRCLFCYEPLSESEVDYHPKCSRKIFGSSVAPILPYQKKDIQSLAEQVIRTRTTLTGVQPKLSLDFDRVSRSPKRFTIVGLWGRYILKPQTELYPMLPEVEDLTMHLAETAKIETVPHSLIRFSDGEICYITQRIDRTADGVKLPMEDMCQLSERMTEDKYKGSHERIAKSISQFSTVPRLDIVKYWEQVVFSWIVGNADMHLKNYSLYAPDGKNYLLTPAYDLLSTALVMPQDSKELALTLCGKKRKLSREHFEAGMLQSGLNAKVCDNIFSKFIKSADQWMELIKISFLTQEMKENYAHIISTHLAKL